MLSHRGLPRGRARLRREAPAELDRPLTQGGQLIESRGEVRFLLLALGIPQTLVGLWALLAPKSFHGDFPSGTDGWIHPLGPFDEHLVTDVGALFVALGFLLAFAARSLRRETVIVAAVAWLIFSIPHFLWHVFNLEPLGSADAIANSVVLAWTVIGGALVLYLARTRPKPATAQPPVPPA